MSQFTRIPAEPQSEKPIAIMQVSNKKQIYVNEAMESALRTPGEIAVERIMRGFWRPQDLDFLEGQLRTVSNYEWRYEAALSPNLWADLHSNFERFQVQGQWFSATTFLDEPQLLPLPEDWSIPVGSR